MLVQDQSTTPEAAAFLQNATSQWSQDFPGNWRAVLRINSLYCVTSSQLHSNMPNRKSKHKLGPGHYFCEFLNTLFGNANQEISLQLFCLSFEVLSQKFSQVNKLTQLNLRD